MKVGEIVKLVGGQLDSGSPEMEISDVGGLYDAGPTEIAFAVSERYLKAVEATKAGCLLAPHGLELDVAESVAIVRVKEPVVAFEKLVDIFVRESVQYEPGVHTTAVIAKGAAVDKTAHIGPLCIIQENTVIGHGTVLVAGVYVGKGVKIGENSLIYPNVTLREYVTVGKRVTIHSGSVLGSDGFGFETDKDGKHHKIPQRGRVVVEDGVEIGACVTIDRARFAKTVIGGGTIIDNLVHIAHNVTVGEDSILVAQVGIAGSSHIGRSVVLAGQAGVDGHLSVGDSVRVAGKAGVTSDVEPGATVAGYPAWPHMKEKRARVVFRKLPELLKELDKLRKRIEALEQAAKNHSKGSGA
jgi:UDP-3-O-[3-hydroxymyristoyl] glucosamine N-acyltransferase